MDFICWGSFLPLSWTMLEIVIQVRQQIDHLLVIFQWTNRFHYFKRFHHDLITNNQEIFWALFIWELWSPRKGSRRSDNWRPQCVLSSYFTLSLVNHLKIVVVDFNPGESIISTTCCPHLGTDRHNMLWSSEILLWKLSLGARVSPAHLGHSEPITTFTILASLCNFTDRLMNVDIKDEIRWKKVKSKT